MIFGVSILAICMLVGIYLGDIFGIALGLDSNIGGVGLSMLFLVLLVDYLTKRDRLSEPAQSGISFWSAMYIPIVVAMAANQNVAGALDGGPLAVLAGLSATFGGWLLVPWLTKVKDEDGDTGGESNVKNIG